MNITKGDIDKLTYRIIGCAIEVHKYLGPGLLESTYQRCFCHALSLKNMIHINQLLIPLNYKGIIIDSEYRLDTIVGNLIIVELKAIEAMLPVHEAQVLTYMKLLKKPKGILINFNCTNIFKGGQKHL